jgi:site-specific DNA-methyltransferase (adenine-specific)
MAVDPVIVVGGARVFAGDCREALKHLPDNSVDSVVTDPPYELGFMGKSWDSSGIAYDPAVWAECLRVLKPGGHILAFGGSRTWHRLAVAVEDAGFELRDSIAWIYGSGFPKSLDVSKAIDKNLGAEREVVGTSRGVGVSAEDNQHGGINRGAVGIKQTAIDIPVTAPATSEAKQWGGWGTALKPAFEPVVVGRKPFGKGVTVAENVLAWGVGGLNIDGSRIGSEKIQTNRYTTKGDMTSFHGSQSGNEYASSVHQGRWPANVIFDEVTAGLLDEQTGVLKSGAFDQSKNTVENRIYGAMPKNRSKLFEASEGGASRFFYVAKASKRDRNEGLEELEATSAGEMVDRVEGSAGMDSPRAGAGRTAGAKNFHPTVKPTALMRYLIKLVTPEGGVVLDPFTGSGSTGKAALLDGFQFVGVELTEEYLPIIEGRLRWASEQVDTDDTLF